MIEEWKPVPGYVGYYEVSNLGKIRSLDRIIICSDGRHRRLRGKLIKPAIDKIGRQTVSLCMNGTHLTQRVHKLVLLAFTAKRVSNTEGCHNNGDTADNSIENLRWDSHSGNMHDTIIHGTCHNLNKIRCPREHLLVMPNLRKDKIGRGHRGCLACNRASANMSKYGKRLGLNFKRLADEHYLKIMSKSNLDPSDY
jgi:hypothetical protein